MDKHPLDAIPEDDIWNTEVLITSYLNNLYYLVMPEFSATTNSFLSDESYSNINLTDKDETDDQLYYKLHGSVANDGSSEGTFNIDTYGFIRKINMLLDNLPESTLDEDIKKKIKGQALFLRTWVYQELFILYGGIPLVLHVQDLFDGNNIAEETYVSRNSMTECINQLTADLDTAAMYLPGRWDGKQYGRITRGAALALKGRLLLYWASPQFNPGNNNERWLWAYNANKEALDTLVADGYGLHHSFADLFNNCNEINNEAIMVRVYDAGNSDFMHNYDNNVRPNPESRQETGSGVSNNPTWNFVQAFPMRDGYPSYASSTEYPYDSVMYWLNRDPRFKFTVGYNSNNYPFSGNDDYKFWTYFYYELKSNPKTGVPDTVWFNAINDKNTNISSTGFYCKKFINPAIDKEETDQIGTDWMEIRFAEVLLNVAECANELDGAEYQTAMYDALNAIRTERDDVKLGMGYIDENLNNRVIMREVIMTERQVEMAFENKRHWDLRRRNMFEEDLGPNIKKLNGTVRYGLRIELNQARFDPLEAATGRETWDLNRKFIYAQAFNKRYFKVLDTRDVINFKQPEYNFYPIPVTQLDKNHKLEQNIYWGGTYDPFDE
jgi:hypothetical protein